ncbi:MXRA5 [Branchiostoma lanceolatum]|uniref:MXRA5 protein n=1 Tax=Branchiostoma lanceolatum TaxID=7740 RepID=A0A8J9ZFL3_BRALA|nr:MXRA5 [Branchiostoma lanceolatum]
MEKRSRQCVAILVLLVLKFSMPCPEECFVKNQFVKVKNCECPRQGDNRFLSTCFSGGLMVAANSICSAKDRGLKCLNDVPTGFDQSVTGIILNRLFNFTTLTKQHIPPLPNLITFVITGSTIQHNLIQTVSPRAFVALDSLDKIALKGNQLKVVPFEALSLTSRRTTVARLQVNLDNNKISTVLENALNELEISNTRISLRLKGNPFICDSRIRWLVCQAIASAWVVISQAGLRCTSPSELAGYDFKSLHTSPFCSSAGLTTASTMATTSASPMATTSASPLAMTSTLPMPSPTTIPATRGHVLEKDLDDGQQAGMDYLYIPVGLTVAVIVLLGGTAVAVVIYKRHVSKAGQNPVHGQHGVIISSQLISNRMYQHSGSVTDDARDHEETSEDSARQNLAHRQHGVIINTSQLISNRLYNSSATGINNAGNDAGTTEETEENSELTPYRTVPFDAINNTLRIEPYSSVNLDDIRNKQTNDDMHPSTSDCIPPSRDIKYEDDMEPYATTPLDQISSRMYQHSGSVTDTARDHEEEEETEGDLPRQNLAHKRHGVIINTSQLISNRLCNSSADNEAGTTEETEQDSELTPYRTVPFDAINNTLRIEPYSSVNLEDICNKQTNDNAGNDSGRTEETEENLKLTPNYTVPFDAINNAGNDAGTTEETENPKLTPYRTVLFDAINNAGNDAGTTEETENSELTPYRTVPFDAINNAENDAGTTEENEETSELRPYRNVPFDAINNVDNVAGTTEEIEQDSELTPYRTVPFDAINNTLRIEPYSSVNLNDIRDEQTIDDLHTVKSDAIPPPSRRNPDVEDEDDMEPYATTPLDQIGDP